MTFLRISAFTALGVWAIDWTIKAAQPWLWEGVSHDAHRSLWIIPLLQVLTFLVVALLESRLAAIAAGAILGGAIANLIDLSANGTVWNMIPVPFSDGLWCNAADIGIIGGLLLLVAICLKSAGTKFAPSGGLR